MLVILYRTAQLTEKRLVCSLWDISPIHHEIQAKNIIQIMATSFEANYIVENFPEFACNNCDWAGEVAIELFSLIKDQLKNK